MKLLGQQIERLSQNSQGLEGFYRVLQKLLDRFFGALPSAFSLWHILLHHITIYPLGVATTCTDSETYGNGFLDTWLKDGDPSGWINYIDNAAANAAARPTSDVTSGEKNTSQHRTKLFIVWEVMRMY